MKKYLIVGCSAAGIAAIEAIRKVDREGKITVVTEEDRPAYGRPLISYYVQGAIDRSRLDYRPRTFYADHGAELITGVRVVSLGAESHVAELSDGRRIPYDRVLAATGSVPFVPMAEGLETVENRLCFYTAADAEKLMKLLTPESRLLIVGAGLIGLKCAEGAYNITKNITVLDLAPRVLSSAADEACSAMALERLQAAGLRVILGDSVKKYSARSCVTEKGVELGFDVLVTAVGVRPNVSPVADAGGEINRGIVADLHRETSIPDVFAAGDCAIAPDVVTGENKVMAVMPGAFLQGETAGFNMAGVARDLPPLTPLNSIGFFGIHVLSAGSLKGDMIERKGGNYLKRFFVENGRLSGFQLVNSYARAGILLSVLRERRPLSELDFTAMTDEPGLADFPRAVRTAKLDM